MSIKDQDSYLRSIEEGLKNAHDKIAYLSPYLEELKNEAIKTRKYHQKIEGLLEIAKEMQWSSECFELEKNVENSQTVMECSNNLGNLANKVFIKARSLDPYIDALEIEEAKRIIYNPNSSYNMLVLAVVDLVRSRKSSLYDLLECLKHIGLPAEIAAISLHIRTKRLEREKNPAIIIDYNDWKVYIEKHYNDGLDYRTKMVKKRVFSKLRK